MVIGHLAWAHAPSSLALPWGRALPSASARWWLSCAVSPPMVASLCLCAGAATCRRAPSLTAPSAWGIKEKEDGLKTSIRTSATMQVNARTEYAVRAMLELARDPGRRRTVGDLARRQHIPATVLPAIVQALARAGLVESTRGYRGGVRLAIAAQDVSLRSIWEAVEGPLVLARCSSAPGPCPLGLDGDCSLRPVWEETQARVLDLWEQTSLAALAGGTRRRAKPPGPARRIRSRRGATPRVRDAGRRREDGSRREADRHSEAPQRRGGP